MLSILQAKLKSYFFFHLLNKYIVFSSFVLGIVLRLDLYQWTKEPKDPDLVHFTS